MTLINMNSVFSSLDERKATADRYIAQFNTEQVKEASRIASLYSVKGSIKHSEDMVKELKLLVAAK